MYKVEYFDQYDYDKLRYLVLRLSVVDVTSTFSVDPKDF